jgi:hypothetical protein
MLHAEASLRTLHAYAGVLQGRLALARVTGTRAEFEGITDGDLASIAALCAHAADGIDAILDRMSPELASNAAAIADVSCQREFSHPRPPSTAQFRVVQGDRSA